MKPKPFWLLNHFTVPVFMGAFPLGTCVFEPHYIATSLFEILGGGRQSGALFAARPSRFGRNSMNKRWSSCLLSARGTALSSGRQRIRETPEILSRMPAFGPRLENCPNAKGRGRAPRELIQPPASGRRKSVSCARAVAIPGLVEPQQPHHAHVSQEADRYAARHNVNDVDINHAG